MLDILVEVGAEFAGGRRDPRDDSPHRALRVAAFRGYADHMATDDFAHDHARLTEIARARRTAFMCAETLWWRCHRRMIADALVIRGWDVRHICPEGLLTRHKLTPFAQVDGERITYPAAQMRLE